MTKEATLISFKDLMQAKMEREQRETEATSLLDASEEKLNSAPENNNSLNSNDQQSVLPDLGNKNIEIPTYLPNDQPTNLATYLPTDVNLHPISPERDFAKLPNSVKRAVEKGKFPGSSLAIYLYLYSLTRAAIKPKRSIRVSKPNLKAGSNIRADKTLLRYLDHLERIGFIRKTVFNGDHGGNKYEVFLPEEVKDIQHSNPPTYLPTERPTYLTKEIPTVPMERQEVGRYVEVEENKTTYEETQDTLLKTKTKINKETDDDARMHEAFLVLAKRLDDAVKKITGKGASKTEAEKWGSLADLLILELEVAARRAESVSSVPAFLTEVLRRQFFAARQQQSSPAKSSKIKQDNVGKNDTGEYEIKSLDEKGREAALEQLREWARDDLLQDFKKWYTPEDWTWLTKELEINQSLKTHE
ncbi:MAG: hypothetical protein H0U87_10545 [Acidobacteria bacterium]|nr:hypothetical protein [Acidobacteriota bacterium]